MEIIKNLCRIRKAQYPDCGGYADDLSTMEEADRLLRIVRYDCIRPVNRVAEASDHWGPGGRIFVFVQKYPVGRWLFGKEIKAVIRE